MTENALWPRSLTMKKKKIKEYREQLEPMALPRDENDQFSICFDFKIFTIKRIQLKLRLRKE